MVPSQRASPQTCRGTAELAYTSGLARINRGAETPKAQNRGCPGLARGRVPSYEHRLLLAVSFLHWSPVVAHYGRQALVRQPNKSGFLNGLMILGQRGSAMMPRTKDFQRLWPTITKLTWCCLEIGDAPPKLWLFLCLSIRPPKRVRTRIDTHKIACGGPKSDTQPATYAKGVLPAKLLFERGRGLTI